MSDRAHIGLDNPSFNGRLRAPARGAQSFARIPVDRPRSSGGYFSDGLVTKASKRTVAPRAVYHNPTPAVAARAPSLQVIKPEPYARPAQTKLQQTEVLRRQTVARPIVTSPRETLPTKRSRAQLALMAMAVIVFLVGVFVSLITLQTNHSAKAQVAALSQKSDQSAGSNDPNAVPSETKPARSSIASYQVAPGLPKYLKIAKFGVSARIKPLSVTSNNVLQAPTNIYDVGWYNASAKPGDAGSNGAMLLDGHVHGPTLPGVFADIKQLQVGDTIQVVRGDNKNFSYVVKKVQNYDANTFDMGMALTSIQPGEPGLNLITCGGPYDRVSGEYTQRTVVFAVQQ